MEHFLSCKPKEADGLSLSVKLRDCRRGDVKGGGGKRGHGINCRRRRPNLKTERKKTKQKHSIKYRTPGTGIVGAEGVKKPACRQRGHRVNRLRPGRAFSAVDCYSAYSDEKERASNKRGEKMYNFTCNSEKKGRGD